MCLTTTAWVNDIGEWVSSEYKDADIKCRRDQEGNLELYENGNTKNEYGLNKIKTMVARTGKNEVERINGRVWWSRILETDK